MAAPPQPSLADDPRGRRALLWDGVTTRTMDGFTGGAILTGVALALGAQDWQLGLLAAMPFLGQLLQLPAVLALERWPDRRRMCILASAAARTVLLAAGLLPLLAGEQGIVPLLVLFAALSVISAFGTASWNAWLHDLLPRDRMGQLFARRLAWQGAAGTVVLLLAGALLDTFRARGQDAEGFATLFALGAAAGYLGLVFLARLPPGPRRAPRAPPALGAVLRKPFADPNFRELVKFNTAWGFAVNLAAPFITVHMLTRLGLPFLWVGAFAALSTLASVVALPVWGRIADRHGNKPVLAICAPVFALSMLLWVASVRDAALATLAIVALIHLLNGIANAGLDLASNNILLKAAPGEDAPSYLATASIARAAASALGPLLGGVLAAWAAPRSLSLDIAFRDPSGVAVLTPVHLAHYDFLFLLTALAGLYAVHRLASVREEGEAPREEVLRALRSEVATMGTMMGLRRFAHVGASAAALVAQLGRARTTSEGRRRQGPRR